MSGHHANIEKWRREQSIYRTAKRRPDLLKKADPDKQRMELCAPVKGNSGRKKRSR